MNTSTTTKTGIVLAAAASLAYLGLPVPGASESPSPANSDNALTPPAASSRQSLSDLNQPPLNRIEVTEAEKLLSNASSVMDLTPEQHIENVRNLLSQNSSQGFHAADRYLSALFLKNGKNDDESRIIMRGVAQQLMTVGADVATVLAANGDMSSAASIMRSVFVLDPEFELEMDDHERLDYRALISKVLEQGGIKEDSRTQRQVEKAIDFSEYIRSRRGEDYDGSLVWRDKTLVFSPQPLLDISHVHSLINSGDKVSIEGYLSENARRLMDSVDRDPEGVFTGACVARRLIEEGRIPSTLGLDGTITLAADVRMKLASTGKFSSPYSSFSELQNILGTLKDFGPWSSDLSTAVVRVAHKRLSAFDAIPEAISLKWQKLVKRLDLDPSTLPL